MGNKDEPDEQPLTDADKNKILMIESLVRMNSDYKTEDLEKASVPALEALYEAEKLKENSRKKEVKPSFMKAPIKHTPPTIPTAKKENTDPDATDFKFNSFEVFKQQYIHPTRLKNCKISEESEILTMRVNANPKFPEWQVS